MFRRKRIWIPILSVLVIAMGCGLFYGRKPANQEPIKIYKAVEVEKKPKPPPPGETYETGHWHGDEWHSTRTPETPDVSGGDAAPPPPPAPESARKETPDTPQTPTQLPADFVNPTSTSSNPLFADGVPEHLQCPPEFIDVYRREDEENFRQRVPRSIYDEIKEKWNPNRPLTEVWPAFIEVEKWYRENADPDRAEFFGAAGRLDWLVQQWLDYPEITVLIDEDAPRASDMLRVEIGLFDPDWNAFTLMDGRTFRQDPEKTYVFTMSSSRENPDGGITSHSSTDTVGAMSGDPNAEVIEIDLDTITDAELEELGGWNFNINPYTTGLYK